MNPQSENPQSSALGARKFEPDIEAKSLVLVGDFNPKIFQPAWFSKEKLMPKREAEQAEIAVVHSEIVLFSVEGYRVQVTRERFAVTTLQAPFYRVLRDLVVGTFQVLSHTPIRMAGLNSEAHFRVASEAAWHAFGHRLAPKEGIWDELLAKPGLQSLTMRGVRPDNRVGYIDVKVAPSTRVQPGLFFSINEHFQVGESSMGCEEIVAIILEEWDPAWQRERRILDGLMSKVGS